MNYNNFKMSKNVHEIKKLDVELTLENLESSNQRPNNRWSYHFKTPLNDGSNRFIHSYILIDYKYSLVFNKDFDILKIKHDVNNSKELWDFMFSVGAQIVMDEHVIDHEVVPCPEIFRMDGGKKDYSIYQPEWCEVNYSYDPSEQKFENVNGVIIQSLDAENDCRQTDVLSNYDLSFQICIDKKSDKNYLIIDAVSYRKFLEDSSTSIDNTSAYLKLHTEQ
jgi:hypothetical protein